MEGRGGQCEVRSMQVGLKQHRRESGANMCDQKLNVRKFMLIIFSGSCFKIDLVGKVLIAI